SRPAPSGNAVLPPRLVGADRRDVPVPVRPLRGRGAPLPLAGLRRRVAVALPDRVGVTGGLLGPALEPRRLRAAARGRLPPRRPPRRRHRRPVRRLPLQRRDARVLHLRRRLGLRRADLVLPHPGGGGVAGGPRRPAAGLATAAVAGPAVDRR